MPDPSGNLMAQSEPRTALFDQRPARVSGLAAVALTCAAASYSRELGFMEKDGYIPFEIQALANRARQHKLGR